MSKILFAAPGHGKDAIKTFSALLATLHELVADRSATTDAWVIKEKLRWIQKVPTPRAARWRITSDLKVMKAAVSQKPLLKPMGKALAALERHADAVVRRWI